MFVAVDVSVISCSREVKQLLCHFVGFGEVYCVIFATYTGKIDELESTMTVFSSHTLIIPLIP